MTQANKYVKIAILKIKEEQIKNVKEKWCKKCKFKDECSYYWKDVGTNLSSLIANPDGSCKKYQPEKDKD